MTRILEGKARYVFIFKNRYLPFHYKAILLSVDVDTVHRTLTLKIKLKS